MNGMPWACGSVTLAILWVQKGPGEIQMTLRHYVLETQEDTGRLQRPRCILLTKTLP